MRPSVLDGKECLLMHLQVVHDIKRICHLGTRGFFHCWQCACKHTLDCEVWACETYVHVYTQICVFIYMYTHALHFYAITKFNGITTCTTD